ncbi:hypothetical protein CEXT_724921 [Caerostris extrusa]|uniref:Uncharacterized protein n=1 Tax=Caerostris extrusa TaxID=172846 RepID=A0AAV4XRQ3_CAEEX|nr:hypothetical protein CEXT_724921 [Caerostris extrusa]
MIMEEGKRWLGKASFTVLSVMFLMSWFELNVFDVTGWVLLIGFVGKKAKDSGYDWTGYDWNRRDPLEIELLGYGFILLILYFHLFMFFYSSATCFPPLDHWGYCRYSKNPLRLVGCCQSICPPLRLMKEKQ